MSGEATTIARPYAEAVFARALETDQLEVWSDVLALLSTVVSDPLMAGLIDRPKLDRSEMTDLILEVGGDQLGKEAQNLVRMLVDNHRLALVPEIARLFEQKKSEHEGAIDVVIESAFALPAVEVAFKDRQLVVRSLEVDRGRSVQLDAT